METFKNPPIIEALANIKGDWQDSIEVSDLDFQSKIKEEFPHKQAQRRFQTTIDLKENNQQTDSSDLGYLFKSIDEKKLIQSKLDGFTYNVLKPYSNWEQMISGAKDAWTYYSKLGSSFVIKRLAVRYINVIELPRKEIELADYFEVYPHIPNNIGGEMEGFLNKLTFNFPKDSARGLISLTPIKHQDPDKTAIMFDNEVFTDVNMDSSSDTIWECFSKLREVKNDLFDKVLTEKTKGLFR